MCRALTVTAFALLLASPVALAASGWKKPYFGATEPGAWATYMETSSNAAQMVSTYRRLSDDQGRARVEMRTSYVMNKFPPIWNHFTIRKGFDLAHDLVDYMGAITEGSASMGNGDTQTYDEAALAALTKPLVPYRPHVVYKSTETIDGKRCDRYSYSLRHDETPPRLESGEFWMSGTVPFGIVKHVATTTDLKGKLLWTFERKLAGFGVRPVQPLPSPEFLAARSHTLKEAYDAGLIRITVVVPKNETTGDHLQVTIETKVEQPFTLVVPAGTTSLYIGPPIQDVDFDFPSSHQFELTVEHPAELTAGQPSQKRLIHGQLQTYVFEGTPLYLGDAMQATIPK